MMSEMNDILLALKKRLALGEITAAEYKDLKAEIMADEMNPVAPNDAFDARATFQGLGIGSLLRDRYEIQSQLGRGGMGVVYKARDRELDTIVAIKVLNEELARDERAVRDLIEEARITMRLTHPHIMRLINFESDERRKFLVMEYIDGETLEKKLAREGKIAEPVLVKLAADFCEGLGYAHKQKIIHRDIKPSNIMLTLTGEIKIMDFGIARVMKDSMTMVTGRTTTGTLIYMSPEQIEGKDVDVRSDLYSLGIMLYELATGKPPFYQGDITHQHLKIEPREVRGISGRLNEILLKCLGKDRSQRYGSVDELKAFLEGQKETDSERIAKADRQKAEREETERRRATIEQEAREAKVREKALMEVAERERQVRQKELENQRQRVGEAQELDRQKRIRLNEEEVRRKHAELNKTLVVQNRSRKAPKPNGEVRFNYEPEMILIPGGTFHMGSESVEAQIDEKPIHVVMISSFKIGKYEVTQAEWIAVMGTNPSHFKGNERLPVESVTWKEAREYIGKLNEMTGGGYRLPTEAEWEYACRAGVAEDRYSLDIDQDVWHSGNSAKSTLPVGTSKENPFGLYDMLGNVWEWCEDWYGLYSPEPQMDPQGPQNGTNRIVRGGSWINDRSYSRCAARNRYDPSLRFFNLGFRLALDCF